ncbi:MAG TPA: MBL fold metallo-hydrolase [Hyphomonas sp.]|nr:MBL fold metallo-hydrolase [Hyphomonas sp.]MCA8905626.1 MBL fold metallo-hydrolase [Hyphomonas sp.]MCB9961060.1 MBL fold metallo-hydrolase [Hyphomonas sp.]MCB9970351.1 MBL fold metallo-hydrolase [Hyphomonas sp.]HPE48510.1 MBL fold metallo-hydrolase [Hyphomonas sp.]
MRVLKPLLVILAALLLAGALARTVFGVQVGEAVFRAAVNKQAGRNALADAPDGLTVVLVGTGSPVPDKGRMGPMTVVSAGGHVFIIDAGAGTGRRFGELGLPWGQVEAAFLTHFHSDHIDGLGEVMLQHWAAGGADQPLPVYGPKGVELVVEGFNEAYALDAAYRIAHHGVQVVPLSGSGAQAFPFDSTQGAVRVYDKDGLTVTAVPVDHHPVDPAVGYRFDYKGRSVTLSGDTAKSQALQDLARDTDLLVHEALNPEMVAGIGQRLTDIGDPRLAKIMHDIPSYHTTPVEAAELAKAAGAKMLVFSHLVPAVPSRLLYPMFLKGTKKAYEGPIILGEDGMAFELPAGSDKIVRKRLD